MNISDNIPTHGNIVILLLSCFMYEKLGYASSDFHNQIDPRTKDKGT